MSTIKFRLAAKTDVGLVRTNNEDNFQIATDLSSNQMRWVNNEICSLGDKGTLLVVADGMGGMNAGEVASALAIETVREYFALDKLTPEVTKNRFSIEKYMNETIIAADARIKKDAKEHPETRGMGTTIVIGWILNDKLYVSWCGDSRAYIYNPEAGLHQITKDHSYVQTLVDKGVITREDAFDYPDSNIITRSLSDGSAKAKPESLLKPYELCDHDIILFCTDGLSGMIRDYEIEKVIRNNEHDMDVLADELIHAACEAEGSDNITLCLCQILQGGKTCDLTLFEEYDRRLGGNCSQKVNTIINESPVKVNGWGKKIGIGLGVCVVVAAIALGIWYFGPYRHDVENQAEPTQQQNPVPSEESNVEEPKNNEDGIETGNATHNSSNNSSKENKERKEEQSGKGLGEESGLDKKGIENILQNEDSDNSEALNKVGNIGQTDDVSEKEDAPEKKDISKKEDTQPYIVCQGDTYYKLSQTYGIGVEELRKLNKGKELIAGDTILVPTLRNK